MLEKKINLRTFPPSTCYRPYLNVKYINPHSDIVFKTCALIDTGADRCILPSDIADCLGHDLEMGEPTTVRGVSGETTCYLHAMQIEIPGFTTDEVKVLFSDDIKTPILGVSSFLTNFRLIIDYPGKFFILKK